MSFYLYERFVDPIQKITGDAHSTLCGITYASRKDSIGTNARRELVYSSLIGGMRTAAVWKLVLRHTPCTRKQILMDLNALIKKERVKKEGYTYSRRTYADTKKHI